MPNDLISREAVLKALRARGRELLKLGTSFESNIASVTALECVNIVKDAPAVDAAPVVHSKWVWIPDEEEDNTWHLVCDACKHGGLFEDDNYCPNCGALMK